MAALLSQEKIPRNLIDTAIRMAESVADELTRGDDREVSINSRSFSPSFPFYIRIYEFSKCNCNRYALKSPWNYR